MKSYCNVVSSLFLILVTILLLFFTSVKCEDPYRFFTWKITYGDIYPLGVKQQVTAVFLSFLVLINNNCHC